MATVVLHVGTHKTGTTALQHSLSIARADLEGWGICYDPDLGRKKSLARAHHALARILAEPETDDTRRILSGYRDFVAGELARGQNVVISSERFYRMEAEETRGVGDARRRYLDRVAGFVSGMPVRLIVYFRRPDTYIESLYKERATLPRATSFADCLEPPISVSYTQRLQEFQATFENVSCFSFEDAVADGLVPNFLRRHALADRELPDGEVRRQGVSFRAAFWLGARQARVRWGGRRDHDMWLFCLDMGHHPLLRDAESDCPWTSPAERTAFYSRMVDGFPHAGFWSTPNEALTPVTAENVDLDAIDALYNDWLQRNQARLAVRRRYKVPPYAPDPAVGRGERVAVWVEQRLRSLARR